MSSSSAVLSQISDARCYLGDVTKTTFEATLKASAFLFDDLRINVTDILSNQFFFDVFFSNEEATFRWLSSQTEGSAILRPVVYQGESFEHVATLMKERGTMLGLKKSKKLVEYARSLDRAKPQFVTMDPYRAEYAKYLRTAVKLLEESPRAGLARADIRGTAAWLARGTGELYQSEVWKFLDASTRDARTRGYLKRVSDTCYYLAQGEALRVSHLSLNLNGAEVVETLLGHGAGAPAVATGERVEEAVSKFHGSALVELSFPEVAILRGHPALQHLREELHKLSRGKTPLSTLVRQMDACNEPLRELASASSGQRRAVILKELKSKKNAKDRGVLIKIAPGLGVAVATVLSFFAPSVFGSLPSNIALLGAGLSLLSFWPNARAANVLSANYNLAERYADLIERNDETRA